MRRMVLMVLALVPWTTVSAQQVEVEEFVLDNGMKFLLVPRSDQPNSISAGWVAKVGSVNERPGITGISHFFEHMMFKGTTTIGTRDANLDEEFRAQQQMVKRRINELIWHGQYERYMRGEIDDPWDAANDTPEIADLRAQLKDLIEEHSDVIVNNEFDQVYTQAGGSMMNAFTANDLTFYFITVPSNKFELWAWMESDRLNDSVFREFYAERDVVHEERRLRTESTPTGIFQEQFDAMFWQSSPYSWPVIGWPSDLNSYTLEQAQEYYATYYAPNNLAGVVVGDFDPAEVKPVIRSYFSRLQRGVEPPPVVTLEVPQMAEKRMNAECDCQPQVEIRYHTVPFNHADSFALEMMSAVLNGRTGRLYKSMVEGRGIASSAQTASNPLGAPAKYAGMFTYSAEVKGDAVPADLEGAWYEELARLQSELIPDRELQKVKNQQAADAFRRLENNFFFLVQLGYFEAMGDWRYINEAPARLQAVTAEDIRRVANTYFDMTNRSVGTYLRKASLAPAEAMDPELAAMPAEIQGQVKTMLQQLTTRDDPGELRMIVGMMEQQAGQVPPEFADAMQYVLKKVRERIAELEGDG